MNLRSKNILINGALIVGSVLFSLLVAELTARIYFSDFRFSQRQGGATILLRSAYPADYDSVLGWIPKAGFSGNQNYWGTQVTILSSSLRDNGRGRLSFSERPSVLAVGDSFTFGDEVSDGETWPAALESATQIRIYNGGVFGYGVDQTSLRLEKLQARFSPELVISSLISDDILRTQLSVRSNAGKPYFELMGGVLNLKGVPVPRLERVPDPAAETWIRGQLSRSVLIDKLMLQNFPNWWMYGRLVDQTVSTDGDAISCAVITRDAKRLRTDGTRLIVLVQYSKEELGAHDQPGPIDRLKKCLAPSRIAILDMRIPLEVIRACDHTRFNTFYFPGPGLRHMTEAGNKFTAELLAPIVVDVLNNRVTDEELRSSVAEVSRGPIVACASQSIRR